MFLLHFIAGPHFAAGPPGVVASPLNFLRSFPPHAVVGARLKQGGRLAQHVKEKRTEWGGKENPDDGDIF